MKKKRLKNYIYTGFGFPVKLHDVEMIMFEGEWHPKIDVRKIAEGIMKSLILQKERLTGNQIKFIRNYFSMSLRQFAKVVNESHAAIKKWEDFGDDITNMDKNIEIMLRLHIYNHVVMKIKNNNKTKASFYNQYVALTEIFSYQHAVC